MASVSARLALLGAVLVGLIAPAAAQAASATPRAEKALQKALHSDLKHAGGSGGALVVDATTGQTLFSASPNAGFLPASVEKLYTTTTALLELGPAARLTTSVYGLGSLGSTGTWHGTIYLRGGGDPTFGSAGFDRAAYGTGATVQQLVTRLKRAGIKAIDGPIVGDESYFDSLRGTPATGYQADLELEGELSGLAFDAGFTDANENALQGRPALFATQQLVSAIKAGGITVPARPRVYTGIMPSTARPLAAVHSPTITTLMQLTNSPSDNFFAETLLKDIGARIGTGGTTAAGAAVVRSVMAQRLSVHPTLDDGSGLSRDDRTSPAQVVSLLSQMQTNQAFVDSLAIAGIRGTMQYEMVGTSGADNCRGKTGTLNDVANLVGYCTAMNGDRLVFAFLLNRQSDPTNGHAIEDQMGEALASYTP